METNYRLYVDESGLASLTDYKSRYFVLAAIVVEESVDIELSAYFNYIKRAHNLPENNNFHSVDLFEKKKSPLYLSNAKCKKLCESLSEFIKIAPFRIILTCLDKDLLRKLIKVPDGYRFLGNRDHKEDKEIGYEILARKTFLEFAKFLKKEKAKGFITAESRKGSDRVLLKAFLQSQEKNTFKQPRIVGYSEAMNERVVSLCFENKNALRGGLEIADLFSYLYNKSLCRELGKLEKRGVRSLWNAVKKKAEENTLAQLQKGDFTKFAKDRIDKIAKRIEQRIRAFSDLVNPTNR